MNHQKDKKFVSLKSKNLHTACVIYEGIWTCKQNYIGETKRNVESQWEEHLDINKIFEPLRNLKINLTHAYIEYSINNSVYVEL